MTGTIYVFMVLLGIMQQTLGLLTKQLELESLTFGICCNGLCDIDLGLEITSPQALLIQSLSRWIRGLFSTNAVMKRVFARLGPLRV